MKKIYLVGSSNKPLIFSSYKDSINENISSNIMIFGDNLVDSSGNKTIDYTITGCSTITDVNLDTRLLSFNCYPDTNSDKVYIDFKSNSNKEALKIIPITIERAVKQAIPLAIVTDQPAKHLYLLGL